jgi:predicted DNA-binding protein YlxM (UPF0122 family)
MAKTALEHPTVELTEKQEIICQYLVNSERPSEIARKLKQSRQAVHSQITLIREKVSRIQLKNVPLQTSETLQNIPTGSTRVSRKPIPLRPRKNKQ